jgi:hypothetical protein
MFFKLEFSSGTGLPDGLFSHQKYQILVYFASLAMKKLIYFMTIWYLFRYFFIAICVIFVAILVNFSHFGL